MKTEVRRETYTAGRHSQVRVFFDDGTAANLGVVPCGLSGCTICSPEPMKVTIMHDIINHPQHYTQGAAKCECGKPIECIQVTETMDFCLGNVVKYCWRHGSKNGVEDLEKAKWYLERAIANAKAAL